jgi:signal peptidase I
VVDQPGLLFDTHTGVMVVNSTLRATPSTKILSGADGDFFNSILVDSAASTAGDTSKRMMGNVIWNYDYKGAAARNAEGVNYVKADPLFVDAAGGDCHVCSGSPAVGGGTAWDGLDASVWSETVAYSNYYRHIYCDMEGNMPYFVNGKPTAGAYQIPGKASVTVAAQGASISATASGAVDWGTEVSVTAADGARQVLGLSVNGEVLEGETSYTFTTSLDDYANGYTVKAVVSTNWYVDAANGTSGATGWSEASALDTLEHVMAKAEAGDTVYALPGNYNTGSMIHTNLVYSLWYSKTNATVQLPSRVVVPAGVRLISTAGAEQTFITGVKAATSTGYGEGAMRCVMMQKGAYLNGFTVTGGGTLAGETAYQYEVFDNVSGGGILCAERPGAPGPGLAPVPVTVVENCIISNNCGQGTSAAIFGSYVHCLFVKNGSGGGNCLVREPQWLYGCVADDNIVDMIAVYQPYYADFCTFGANNRGADGTPYLPNGLRPGSHVRAGELLWCGTVKSGDFLFVNRWIWNFRHPKRGEVMIFATTGLDGVQQGTHYIKRMAGLPGETLTMDPPRLVVNGEPVPEEGRLGQIMRREKFSPDAFPYPGFNFSGTDDPRFDVPGRTLAKAGDEVMLGPDEYYACGDNSPASYDSRWWGPVPGKLLRGRAGGVFWPFGSPRWGIIR